MTRLFETSLIVAVITTALAAQSPLYTVHGSDPDGRFGFVVRSIGDADGDGHTDFGVGAPKADANGILDSGMLQTFSGATGIRLREYRGDREFEESGCVLACVGDVDGDGKADLAFADCDGRWRYPGQFTVASGSSGRVLFRVHGQAAYDLLGQALCGAGDVDGDGYADIAAGEPGCDENGHNSGRVRVFSGRTRTAIHGFVGTGPNEDFGAALACAGDVDGDGILDLIVGAPRADQPGCTDCGMVRLFSGKTGAILRTWYGDAPGDQLGCSVDGGADLDGDGIPDVVAGARLHDGTGQVKAFSTGDLTWVRSWNGSAAGEQLGAAVTMGDLDGDGLAEVIAGAPSFGHDGQEHRGRVLVFAGVNGSVLTTLYGTEGSRFGFSVDTIDDADGYANLVIGAPDDAVNGIAVGSAYFYSFTGAGTPPSVTYRGAGCRGTDRRLPRIDVFGRPALGGSYDALLRGARPSSIAALNIGTLWDQPLGSMAPDCTAYAYPLAAITATTDADGAARLTPFASIPVEPALIGIVMHHQWLVVDQGANNTLGLAVSNDAVVRVGE